MNKVPDTNNAGENHARKPLTAEQIIVRSQYNFRSSVVRLALGEKEYTRFVKKYVEKRTEFYKGRCFVPLPAELDLFDLIEKGKLSIDQAASKFGYKSKVGLLTKLGRLYAYRKENSNGKATR